MYSLVLGELTYSALHRRRPNLAKLRKIVVNAEVGTLEVEVYLKGAAQPSAMSLPVAGLRRITGGTDQLADQGTWTGATFGTITISV